MQFLSILANARKQMEKTVDDFNRALPALKAVGLSVTDFHVRMALLPAVIATLQGSFNDMDSTKIRHLKEGATDNKVLSSILRALETAANIKKFIGGLIVEGIEVRVKLSLFPDVDVGFIVPKSGSIHEPALPNPGTQ